MASPRHPPRSARAITFNSRIGFTPSKIGSTSASLTWREIATTAVTLLMWDIVSKPLIALFWRHARRPLSWGLFKLAVALKP